MPLSAALAAALPAVCLLYSDANLNAAFGLLRPADGTVAELLELDWAGMPEGIDASGVVDGQQRWMYNVGVGSGAGIVDVMAVLSWVPELGRMTVTYADLPASMPKAASAYGGSVAFANIAFDAAGAAAGDAPLVGIMQPGSGDETWLAAGSWNPFTGVIASVDGNFTGLWAGSGGYKYGCATWDPVRRVLYQCFAGEGPSEAVVGVALPLPGAGGGGTPYAPLAAAVTLPMPPKRDILAVAWSPALNATVVLAAPFEGQAGNSSVYVHDAAKGAFEEVLAYDGAALAATTLGGLALSADGAVGVALLSAVPCDDPAGCAVLSYVDLAGRRELARVPLANTTTLVADVQLCEGVKPPAA